MEDPYNEGIPEGGSEVSRLMDLNRASAEKVHSVDIMVEGEPVTLFWMNLTTKEEPMFVAPPAGIEEAGLTEEEEKLAKQFATWQEMVWRRIEKANNKLGEVQLTREEFFEELTSEVQAQIIMGVMKVEEKLQQDFQNGPEKPRKQSLFTGHSLNEE